MKNLPTVFIVDDDQDSREAVAALACLIPAPFETFDSAEAFLRVFDCSRRGCLVTDVRMPGRSGLELFAELARRKSRLPVIVTTAYGDIRMAVGALRAGVLTFLQKPCRGHELWEAIRDALAADAHNHDRARRLAETEKRLSLLSEEERQVLEMMLEDVPCKGIAKHLGIGMRTAQARRAAVFTKMGVDSLPRLALMVRDARDVEPTSAPYRKRA